MTSTNSQINPNFSNLKRKVFGPLKLAPGIYLRFVIWDLEF